MLCRLGPHWARCGIFGIFHHGRKGSVLRDYRLRGGGLVGTTITNTPFADGAISSVPIAFASNAPLGSQSLQINGTFSANNLGAAVTIVPGATYSITVLSRCDVNGDGAINSLDVTAVINGINGKGSCPLSGGCNLQSVVAVVIAALGGACSL